MNKNGIDQLDPKKNILIKGARLHNLKNLSVAIPRNKLVVITGISGSGKSSLAFDTLYAEGQRRYVESLSSYARQFLGRLNKPEVDYIKGIAPAIAIEQKVNSRNPRSTVGTSTEVYDYLKLLYARIGKTISPVSGNEVKRHTVTDVSDYVNSHKDGTKLLILSPLYLEEGRKLFDQIKLLQQQGYTRLKIKGDVVRIDEYIDSKKYESVEDIEIVVDRIAVNSDDEDNKNRISDSAQTAFFEGHGVCRIENMDTKEIKEFSNKFELDGLVFEEPSVHLFSFNNPYGACPKCEGYGSVIGIDEDLVIPDTSLSIYDDAVVAWKGEKMQEWKEQLVMNAYKFDFPIHKPYYQFTKEERKLLWDGNKYFEGLNSFFKYLESKSYKIQYRVMLSRYRGKTLCNTCEGARLRQEATYIKLNGKAITELVDLPISKLANFFNEIELDEHQQKVAKRLLIEINTRLKFLNDVGLGYLTLNRISSTLSGGESQRINLATSLGSSLVGSMYILDEPSIGLHSRDTERLIKVLLELRDLGNTVIVVEHDEDIMKAADEIIDIGPYAGTNGGELIFQGDFDDIANDDTSLTAKYLNGKLEISVPEKRIQPKKFIELNGVRHHNLKNIDVKFGLGCLTAVTGVSGSGKSSLIKHILYPAIKKHLGESVSKKGQYKEITGALDTIKSVEFVDQNPIGKSSRSNPVTYIKAYDEIRSLFADQQLSKVRGYKTRHFSFNIDGGRCETCQGEGEVTIEMQFMADVHLVCETCNGKRFKKEVLEVTYADKNISDILELTIDEAVDFFEEHKQAKVSKKLKPLQDVGLGYVHLGQSSSTLSGGEAQRVKLASFLSKGSSDGNTLFIFDEPTTGLHFHDIKKLLDSFNALIEQGHTILVIEHNPDVIKSADWVVDLGPEGGEDGGNVVATGTPEEIVRTKGSYTGIYLKEKLNSAVI